jgi:hypothetical protein
MSHGRISIKSLKKFVYEHLPTNSTIRDLILAEPDQMSTQEFLIKMEIWLRLIPRIKIRGS